MIVVRRLLVMLLFVLAPIPFAAAPAHACSCKASAGHDRADLAFVGVVRSIDEQAGALRVAFDVETVARGEATGAVTLTTSDTEAACGYRFDTGGRYRVFATAGQTSLCSGNEIVTATPAYTARVQRVSTDRTTIFWGGSAAVALVVTGALALLLRQPRSCWELDPAAPPGGRGKGLRGTRVAG